MSEIPEDIRAKARKLAKEAIYHGGVDWATDDIAAALLAERKDATERAAKVADDTAAFHLNASKMCLPVEPSPIIAKDRAAVANRIAAAIRGEGRQG